MDDITRKTFAAAICKSQKPDDLPRHYIDFYELLSRRWWELLSDRIPPRREWAMLATVSELLDQKQKQIAALEARLAALESRGQTQTVHDNATVVDADESIEQERPGGVRGGQLRSLKKLGMIGTTTHG